MLTSQCRGNGRDLSITASQPGKTKIGGAVSSTRRAQTTSSIARVKSYPVPFLSRVVIGHVRRAMLGRNLRQ